MLIQLLPQFLRPIADILGALATILGALATICTMLRKWWAPAGQIASVLGRFTVDVQWAWDAVKGAIKAIGVSTLGVVLLVLVNACSLFTSQSAPQTAAVVTVIDGAICTALADLQQDEPGWEKFVCSLLGTSDVIHVKVPKAQAAAFESAHRSFQAPAGGR